MMEETQQEKLMRKSIAMRDRKRAQDGWEAPKPPPRRRAAPKPPEVEEASEE